MPQKIPISKSLHYRVYNDIILSMENESRLEHLKAKLESEVGRLARKHQSVVSPLEQKLNELVEKEKDIIIGEKVDTYSVHQTVRGLCHTEANPEDRIKNLLAICRKTGERGTPEPPLAIPYHFIVTPLLFHQVRGKEFSSFFSQLEKIVSSNAKQGMSAKDMIDVLEKFEFTTFLIGTTTKEKEF